MDKEALTQELARIIGGYIRERGMELVELILRHEGQGLVLRVLVDWPGGGITMGECARLNQQISHILDSSDIIQQRYMLEVCSPGLDRPLVTRMDFSRCQNKTARFFLREAVNGKIEIEGVIAAVTEDAVEVHSQNLRVSVPLAKIARAKQVIDAA